MERDPLDWLGRSLRSADDPTWPRVVIAAFGPFQAEQVESRFIADEPGYPPDVEQAFASLDDELRRRAAYGEGVPFDSDGFKLISFREPSPGELELVFGPTTYYRMLVTNRCLDRPQKIGQRTYTLRERYASAVDLRVAPIPQLANFWSVGVSIVTADGWLLISERGDTASDPNVCGPAVAEGGSRRLDSVAGGVPDHVGIARRGILEELGIGLRPDELVWLSLSADADACDYALLGRVRTHLALREIEDRRSSAAGDAWETKRLHAVEFSPEAVAQFCMEPERQFSPFGLAVVIQTLLHEFGLDRTAQAFPA